MTKTRIDATRGRVTCARLVGSGPAVAMRKVRVAPGAQVTALREMRRARRRRAYAQIDWIDAVYRVYVTGLFSAVGISMLSGVIGGRPVTRGQLAGVLAHGPAVVGLVVAVVIAAGVRSGGRGGPLVLLPADVGLVLLAPISRAAVLRGLGSRQLRFSGFAGGVVGMVAGNLAAQRLPGPYAAWVATGGLAGVVTGLAFTGSAVLISGLRAGRRLGNALAGAAIGWSAADLAFGIATSPATFLGRLVTAPLPGPAGPPVGAVLLALPVAGLAAIGGTSLEAARRRAGLAAQLRFAVTMQDVRAVILLRRQLAAEGPRRRPWLRLRAGGPGGPVWRRDLQGILRWPGARVGRVLALGVIAGAAADAAWQGTPALIGVSGIALLVAALDAVEGLAQEADHPTRSDMLPVAPGKLVLRHLAAPCAVMLAVSGVAVATAVVLAGELDLGPPSGVLALGAIVAGPAALATTVGAALSIKIGPVANLQGDGPVAKAKLVARAVGPPLLAIAGVDPVVTARAAVDGGGSALLAAAGDAALTLVVALAVAAWLGRGR